MIFPIAHRISNILDLELIPLNVGIEFDVHAYGKNLVIAHDAFLDGTLLSDFLTKTLGRFLAINIKEEGIEKAVIAELKKMNIDNFFLFDVTTPQIFRLGKNYSNFLAIRLSQIETINLKLCRKYAKYIWLDTFDGSFWPEIELLKEIKGLGYQICFVSPELHRPPLGNQTSFINDLRRYSDILDNKDAICTKHINAV